MKNKRIIPCMDIKDGRVVKGVKFENVREVDDPVELARYYNATGADVVVFYDIAASIEGRGIFTELFKRVASEVTVPLMAGGGINKLDDFERLIDLGAATLSVNSGALSRPAFIEEAAVRFGSERFVLSMDVSLVNGTYRVFKKGGMVDTGTDAVEWAKYGADHGAGELVINSIDKDGVKEGYDTDLLAAICSAVKIPVIASGGAGRPEHFAELFKKVPDVDAGLAASVFHFKEIVISDLKRYLEEKGIEVSI